MLAGSKLAGEREVYEQHRAGLLARAQGKWVLIKGTDVVGTYDTEDDALEAGYNRFGGKGFFTHKITLTEAPAFIWSCRAAPA